MNDLGQFDPRGLFGSRVRLVEDGSDVPAHQIAVRDADRYHAMMEYGGVLLSGQVRVPRILADPVGVFEEIHNSGENGRSGWLPPVVDLDANVNQRDNNRDCADYLGDVRHIRQF